MKWDDYYTVNINYHYLLQSKIKTSWKMQHDQETQNDQDDINPTADSSAYVWDCRDTISNLVERIWSIPEELMTHLEQHGPRIVGALREEHKERHNLKVLMNEKVQERMEFIDKLIIWMKKYSCFDSIMGADIRQSILNDL